MRLILISFLAIASFSLVGQSANKGKFYLSGNTALNYRNNLANDFAETRFEASQIGFFLSNRLLAGGEFVASSGDDLYDGSSFTISPFLRYYLPVNQGKAVQFFGEAGFGTFGNFSFGSSFETDFYLGVGAEQSFGDGIVGTARLRYKANASGLNFTELDLGLNFILGGQQSWEGFSATRRKGTYLVDPRLGRISFGHRSRGNFRELRLDLNASLGYFLTEQLLVEAGYNTESFDFNSEVSSFRSIYSGYWEAFAGLRYFIPATKGRWKPYLLARAGWVEVSTSFEGTIFDGSTITGLRVGDSSDFFAEGGAGTLYFLTQKVALDANLRYQALDNPTQGRPRAFYFSTGLKVFLGK